MGQDTTNLAFYLPDAKEDDWGDEKNSDWQDLDTRLKNLPADGTHGNAAHATDYAATGHTHPASDLEQSSATNGQHLAWDGSAWVPVDPPADTNTQTLSVEKSGSVTLSSGSAIVSTSLSEPVEVTLDPTDGGSVSQQVEVSATARNDGSGTIEVKIYETGTDVGNPTVGYDILTVN